MKIKVNSFYDYADECKKFYSVHGEGFYCNTYEEALREELIALGLLIPKVNGNSIFYKTEIPALLE